MRKWLVALLLALPLFAQTDREAAINAARVRASEWLLERGATVGIFDPDAQLKETSVNVLKTGVIIRYQQMHEGIPVYHRDLVLSVMNQDVRAHSMVLTAIRAGVEPTVAARQAEAIAIAKRELKTEPQMLESKLFIVPKHALDRDVPSDDRLAWEVVIATDDMSRTLIVDALTSDVISDTDNVVCSPFNR